MKANKDVKVITYCDFGEEGRKDVLVQHRNFSTALRQYKKLWDVYHRIHGWKVWQEVQDVIEYDEAGNTYSG